METDEQIHRHRNWVATIVTFCVLGLISLFFWRVFFFARLIQQGEIDLDDVNAIGSLTTASRLASIPIPEGEFDVVSVDDPSIGSPDAKMTIVEFADFGCPYSREVSFTIRTFVQEHPDDIYYVYRDFPIAELHPFAQTVAEASECAQEQDAFWPFHDKVYQSQNDLSEERLYEIAREIDLNESRFRNCLQSGRYAQEVQDDYQAGLDAGVRGTPTFFINGNRIAGNIPAQIFEGLLASLKKNAYAP